MQVDIWSDVVCPFCYVGKRQFEKALEQFDGKDNVTIKYHSFELNRDALVDNPQSMYEMLSEKFGKSPQEAREMNQRIFSNASDLGIQFNFDDVQLTNSFDSHRLIQFAASKNKEAQMKERVQKAYFTDGLNIGHHDVLTKIAGEVGLDENEVKTMLETSDFTVEVRNDELQANELGINGVPFFIIDMKYGISGAQGVENLLEALKEAEKSDV